MPHRVKTPFLVFLSAAVGFFGIIFLSAEFPSTATAGVGHNVSGYIWSSNAGYISFNNLNTGDSTDYGVTVSPTTGTGAFSGYAWSPSVGWVSFSSADLTGCPAPPCAPTLDWNTGVVSGWARALSPIVSGGGWDGWINLSGVTVNTVTKQFTGYAWGADVFGWMDFSGVIIGAPPTFEVCEQTSSGPFPRTEGMNLSTLQKGASTTLRAFYDTTPGDCSGTEVTMDPGTSWQETADSKNIYTLSPGDVFVSSGATGNGNTGSIKVSNNGQEINLNLNLPCYPSVTCSSEAANTCDGQSFTVNDPSCGIQNCTGNRYCDFNWREVAP